MLIDDSTAEYCIAERISPDVFYLPTPRKIYSTLLDLFLERKPGGIAGVALALGENVSSVGGFSELTRLESLVPTTATVKDHLKKLITLKGARDTIRSMQSLIEEASNISGSDEAALSDLLASAESRMYALRSGHVPQKKLKSFMDFEVPADDDVNTLLGDRFICRGHAALMVGGSGMGKSTLAYQASAAWALGRPFLGIVPKKKIVSLHVQAEDEDGDIAEIKASVIEGMKLSSEDIEVVRKNFIVKTEKAARGKRFLRELQILCAQVKPDIVWMNPLHAYMEGDIKDAESIGRFCREGLGSINPEDKWAYVIVHHTPKPTVGKDKTSREWNEIMYEAAGSADLVNWARAVLVLKALSTEGSFDLHLAKRGKKAEVVKEVRDAHGAINWELTTRIPIRHSKGKINVPGRKKPVSLQFWEPRVESLDATEPTKSEREPVRLDKTKNSASYTEGELLHPLPHAGDPVGLSFMEWLREASHLNGISKAQLARRRSELIDAGLVDMNLTTGRFTRTEKGDAVHKEFLRNRK